MAEKLKPHLRRVNSEPAREKARKLEPFKENWQVNFGVLTISGESGTGKTTLAEILAQVYGIPDERNIKIGQIVRDLAQQPQEEGFIQRPISVDERVDNAQKEIMKMASTEHPFILEARLAGAIASIEKTNSPQLPIVSILLTASLDAIVDRIQSRRPDLSRKEIIQKEKERADKDLKQWKQLHTNLDNPYDPKYFNLTIDTDLMSPEQVFIFLHNWLLEHGFISKKENNDTSPGEHQIFPSPNA